MTTVENAVTWMGLVDAANEVGIYGVIQERYGHDRDLTMHYRVLEINGLDIRICSNLDYFGTQGTLSTPDNRTGDDSDRWCIPDQSEFPSVPPTYIEFFDSVDGYTLFTAAGDEYVFFGWDRNDEDELEAIFYGTSYLDRIVYGASYLNQQTERPRNWVILRDENGLPKQLDRFGRRMLNQIEHQKKDRVEHQKEIEQLRVSFREATQDIRTINGKINGYADETNMCSDYERRISEWNDELTFKLLGREKDWVVPVRIESLSSDELNITVIAHSKEQAIQLVSEMSKHELLTQLLVKGWIFDNLNVSFDDVETPYIS